MMTITKKTVALNEIAGSNIGCFSMYMPFWYSPIDDKDPNTNSPLEQEYQKYANDSLGTPAYNQFLANYFEKEMAHRAAMKENIAPVIDYNRIFKAEVQALLTDKKANTDESPRYDYYTSSNDYLAAVRGDVSGNKLASTVIHFSLVKPDDPNTADKTNDADKYIEDLAGKASANAVAASKTFSYDGNAFEAFKDTVEKITVVTTQKATVLDATGASTTDKTDIVVARGKAELSDISANGIDIGLYDYANADTYSISGYKKSSDGTIDTKYTQDYATPVSTSSIMDKMTEMRTELDSSYTKADAGLWQAIQGKVTTWIDGVKSKVESAVLHFKADSTADDTYNFIGVSTAQKENSGGNGFFSSRDSESNILLTNENLGKKYTVEVDEENPSDPTQTVKVEKDLYYTISFYHYIVDTYNNPSDTARDGSNRYMLVSVSSDDTTDAVSYGESQLIDETALYTNIAIEQPEYSVENLTLTMKNLVSMDADTKDSEDTIKQVYDNNSKYGYGALIESTSGNTTAVDPAYIDVSQANSNIGSDAVVHSGQSNGSGTGRSSDDSSASRSVSSSSSETASPAAALATDNITPDMDILVENMLQPEVSADNALITDVTLLGTPEEPSPFGDTQIEIPTPFVDDNNEVAIVSEPASDNDNKGSAEDSDNTTPTEGGGSDDGDNSELEAAEAQD